MVGVKLPRLHKVRLTKLNVDSSRFVLPVSVGDVEEFAIMSFCASVG